MKEEEENITEKDSFEEEEIVPTVYRSQNVRASGYCSKCRQRYNDVPVIDGVVACPNCYPN